MTLLLGSDAIFHTSEICTFTLEALIICEFEQGPFLQILVVRVIRLLKAGFLVYPLELRTLNRLLNDFILYFLHFNELVIDQWTVRCLYSLLALGTVKEIEDDTGSRPPFLDSLMQTLYMEQMAAL